MAEEFLDGADVDAVADEMGGEGVPQSRREVNPQSIQEPKFLASQVTQINSGTLRLRSPRRILRDRK